MSSDINSFNHSIELEPAKLNYKSELNALWAYFMTAYNYSKYYTDKEIKQSNDITKDNRIKAIKKLSSFFQKYNIKILSNDSLYSTTNKNILKEAKIWIMYIIINIRKETTISSICNIFDYAISYNCDVISMFEFYLIFISELNNNKFDFFFNSEDCILYIPESFIYIYRENKQLLRNIFHDNSYSDIDSDILLSEEEENNDLIVISKDFLKRGIYAIFKKKNRADNKYILMPLKEAFVTLKEKRAVTETLQLIAQSEYYNFEYYPYDSELYSKLHK